MDTIDGNVMQLAAEHVIRTSQDNDIHTVVLELNGQHGGVDVVLKGFPKGDTHEFVQKFEVH